ncbi:MAG: hypothetical protein CMA72_07205 [Euryarchaeota archaeon]|nr:hypothetical protein [Euryarchaeota archaeon]|tara:strand:+ start:1630 stop:1896 length:267 start_codon:yes stop_codon:yes gene_type:complete
MKVGDIVTNTLDVRANPVVNESRGWKPIPRGCTGIVLDVRETTWNSQWRASGKGDVYVDVLMTTPEGDTHRCGNYHSGSFEVIHSMEA